MTKIREIVPEVKAEMVRKVRELARIYLVGIPDKEQVRRLLTEKGPTVRRAFLRIS